MKQTGKKNQRLPIIVAIVALLVGYYLYQIDKQDMVLPELKSGILLPTPKALPAATLLDQHGQPFTIDNFKGYWNLVFFGFTHCPDICPTTLQQLSQIKQTLSDNDQWGNYRIVFVSVDPERDTPDKVKHYASFFDKDLVGLTGDKDQVLEFAKNLGIIAVKTDVNESGGYNVDHGASVIMLNPKAQWAGVISAPINTDELTADLALLLTHYEADHQARPIPTVTATATTATATTDPESTTKDVTAPDEAATKADISTGLAIENGWIRAAPPGAMALAGYMTISNTTDEDFVIKEASSDAFGNVMIHETVFENNTAKMQHIDALTIPAGSSVALAPHGLHLMLMMPEQAIATGDIITVTLTTDDEQTLDVPLTVKKAQ